MRRRIVIGLLTFVDMLDFVETQPVEKLMIITSHHVTITRHHVTMCFVSRDLMIVLQLTHRCMLIL